MSYLSIYLDSQGRKLDKGGGKHFAASILPLYRTLQTPPKPIATARLAAPYPRLANILGFKSFSYEKSITHIFRGETKTINMVLRGFKTQNITLPNRCLSSVYYYHSKCSYTIHIGGIHISDHVIQKFISTLLLSHVCFAAL